MNGMRRLGGPARMAGLAAALQSAGAPVYVAALQCPDGSPPPCRAVVRASTPAPNSVAVLHFDNLSRDTADAYLADGLTDEIIARLAQIERLKVKSRTALARYPRSAPGPAALSRELGVAYVVNGTVRRGADRLRVTVELLQTTTGDRLWGQQYDRARADLLAIQQDIAVAVATAVAGRLLPAERSSLAARPTRNPDAYDHFVKGNYFLAQRTARTVARAIEEYRAAVQLDSSFSRALARIAYAYALVLDWGWEYSGAPAESLLVRGFAAADGVLRRDSSASDAWMARAYLLSLRDTKTLADALGAFERAIALDPRNAEAHHQYGGALRELGRDAEAAGAYHRALELDPERPVTLVALGALRVTQQRYAEGLHWLDSAVSTDPGSRSAYALRALDRLLLGQTAHARRDAEVAVRLGSGYLGEAVLATVEAHEGDTLTGRGRIDNLLRGVVDSLRPRPLEGLFIGWALVALNERDRALDLLERVHPQGWQLWHRLRYPGFDPLRAHPRFQRLVAETKPREAPR